MPSQRIATQTRIRILDETDDWLILDKPAPLKVHPGAPDGSTTLYDELCHLLVYELANGGQISIINRLDRETSGITLVAKTQAAARRFGIAMQERRFHKTYLAWVFGHPTWTHHHHTGPILRRGSIEPYPIYVKQWVHPAGSACETLLEVLQLTEHHGQPIALVQAQPITGRMHQIRVHLSDLGHPLLGDKLYGFDDGLYLRFIETGWTPQLAQHLLLPRQALHATTLTLEDGPTWHCPLPAELTPPFVTEIEQPS
jgi:23S rRNA pseudouridine1911/1915/1917 synthase